MPIKYVDPVTGKEVSKEDFEQAKSDAKDLSAEMVRKQLERDQQRKSLIHKAGEKLGLSPEDSLLLFGG